MPPSNLLRRGVLLTVLVGATCSTVACGSSVDVQRSEESVALARTCASIIERIVGGRDDRSKDAQVALLDDERLIDDPEAYYRELAEVASPQRFGEGGGGSDEARVPNVVAFRRDCGRGVSRDAPAPVPGG